MMRREKQNEMHCFNNIKVSSPYRHNFVIFPIPQIALACLFLPLLLKDLVGLVGPDAVSATELVLLCPLPLLAIFFAHSSLFIFSYSSSSSIPLRTSSDASESPRPPWISVVSVLKASWSSSGKLPGGARGASGAGTSFVAMIIGNR